MPAEIPFPAFSGLFCIAALALNLWQLSVSRERLGIALGWLPRPVTRRPDGGPERANIVPLRRPMVAHSAAPLRRAA